MALRMFAGIVLAILLLGAPVFLPSLYLHLAILCLYYAYLASSWNILGGVAGQTSLAPAAFVGVGAYTSTLAFNVLGITPWVGMFLGAVVAALLGFLISWISFRCEVKQAYFALITLAFSQIVYFIFNNTTYFGGSAGISVKLVTSALLFQFPTKAGYYYTALVMLVILLGTTLLMMRARFGASLLAIRENEDAAEALGVDVVRTKVIAGTLASFCLAFGGTIYAQYVLFITPGSVFHILLSFEIIAFVIVGGTGTVFGPAVGALVLIPLGQFMRNAFVRMIDGPIDLVLYGMVLMVAVMLFPEGIIGWFTHRTNSYRKRAGSKIRERAVSV